MNKEFQNIQIARFALSKQLGDIPETTIDQLKKHLLDSLGSLCFSMHHPVMKKFANYYLEIGGSGNCAVPLMGKLPCDRAAQLYTALIRHLDFMDNFIGKEATCHPSDNIGSLLAMALFKRSTSAEFLAAMAVAYQIQCRLALEIPVMKEGIDHTLMLAYSITASIARLLHLDVNQTAHALGIIGSSMSPLVTSRASYTYEWKGFVSSLVALSAVNVALLAEQGMTGPIDLFEGPKGFAEIFNMKLNYDWSQENFSLIPRCALKNYNAEVHTQSAIEATLEIKSKHSFDPASIESIEVTTFLTAYHITGSGAYGDRQVVHSKEQADHSLFYVVAVAAIDGEVTPTQFTADRINRDDVQSLLQRVSVRTVSPFHQPIGVAAMFDPFTIAYPDKTKSKVEIKLKNGERLTCEKDDFHGFHTRPMSWDDVITKFKMLSDAHLTNDDQQTMIDIVRNLEKHTIEQLIDLLARKVVPSPADRYIGADVL